MPHRSSSTSLENSIDQLDELFLLVIVGEFNSGKSAFINALLGSRIVAEGVTPTTAQINVLQYGETVERHVRGPHLHVITAPGSAAARDPHRRHAGHQRDHPRARGDHRRVRPAVGPRPLRDVRGPAVHRNRARVPRAGAALGQEGRHRHQQGRHPREREPTSNRSRLRHRERALASGVQPGDPSRQRASGAACEVR